MSAPAVVLAAAAARTRRIRLTSAVTVLSSDDPVRVFQDFATLDLLSQGRAEIMAGRGSFIESFPLFGYDLAHYDELFAEKLELLLALRDSERVTWRGRHHPDIDDRGVYPRPEQDPLPVWIAVGGTPASVVARGLPRAAPGDRDHRRLAGTLPPARRPPSRGGPRGGARGRHPHRDQHPRLRGRHVHARRSRVLPALAHVMTQLGRERGWSPMTEEQYEVMRSPLGALAVGDPAEVAEKILSIHRIFGNRRFLMQMSVGTMPHDAVMRSIELYATEVAPVVRAEVARREAAAPAGAGG